MAERTGQCGDRPHAVYGYVRTRDTHTSNVGLYNYTIDHALGDQSRGQGHRIELRAIRRLNRMWIASRIVGPIPLWVSSNKAVDALANKETSLDQRPVTPKNNRSRQFFVGVTSLRAGFLQLRLGP